MPHDSINVGYARALFEMANAENVVSRIEEELFRLRDLLKKNPNLLQFLRDPNVTREGKRNALTELFEERLHALTLNTLLTLADQDRTNRVLHVIEEFTAIASAARETLTGEVTTAFALDDATLQRLAAELSNVTGKNVQLLQRVDPAILGGVLVKIGEQIIDGSLRRKLDELKKQLSA